MSLRAIGKYIILKPVKLAEDRNGILIPDEANVELKQRGEVVAVPAGVKMVKPGDHVIAAGHSGYGFMYDGKPYLSLKQEDIIAFCHDERFRDEPELTPKKPDIILPA